MLRIYDSSQLTFCSEAVTSCSAFTSLNLKSLICLLASPGRDGRSKAFLSCGRPRRGGAGRSVPARHGVDSLCCSVESGSVPFSRTSPPGLELFSAPFRCVFCSSWDLSFFTCGRSHEQISPTLTPPTSPHPRCDWRQTYYYILIHKPLRCVQGSYAW